MQQVTALSVALLAASALAEIHGREISPYLGTSRTPCRQSLEALRANTTVNDAADRHFLVAHDTARNAYLEACHQHPNQTAVCWYSVQVTPSQIAFGQHQISSERQRLYHSSKSMLVPFCAPMACSSNSLAAIAAAHIQWRCKSALNRDCTINRDYGCTTTISWRPSHDY